MCLVDVNRHLEDTGLGGNEGGNNESPPQKSGLGKNLILYVLGRVILKIYI